MRGFSYLLVVLISTMLFFSGCETKGSGVAKMHWDRDMCERCKMAISDRKFASQAIDIKTKRVYKFDDIGCAVLWLSEENIPLSRVKLYVTDAKSGRWIDAKEAKYVDDLITPMAYGFGAYSKGDAPKNKTLYDFDYIKGRIFEIEKTNSKKVNSL